VTLKRVITKEMTFDVYLTEESIDFIFSFLVIATSIRTFIFDPELNFSAFYRERLKKYCYNLSHSLTLMFFKFHPQSEHDKIVLQSDLSKIFKKVSE
jgi:hypothetical protein